MEGGASLQTAQIVSGQFKKLVSSLPLLTKRRLCKTYLKAPEYLLVSIAGTLQLDLLAFRHIKKVSLVDIMKQGQGVAGKLAKDATMGTVNVIADELTNTKRLGAIQRERTTR